jgi:hypothetical protein
MTVMERDKLLSDQNLAKLAVKGERPNAKIAWKRKSKWIRSNRRKIWYVAELGNNTELVVVLKKSGFEGEVWICGQRVYGVDWRPGATNKPITLAAVSAWLEQWLWTFSLEMTRHLSNLRRPEDGEAPEGEAP